ncbi:MAG: 2-dehydropantoate 2-reductase [Planctomycetaceae bacterium]|nr:2-dehydropantoate 2-reductase [Planctomycetaceae bacterium]
MGHDTIAADGLFVREMKPNETPKGAFLLLHGMESHSEWFVDLASRLVSRNYAVVAYDRPGWGGSPGTRGHLASYRDFVENTVRLATLTRAKYGAVHLASMSWGGMATLYLGLRRGWLFDSLTLISPGLAARRDLSFRDKCRLGFDFLKGRADSLVEPLFSPEHFSHDPHWQRFIEKDPLRVRQVTSSFCFETLKMRRFIAGSAGRRLLPPTLCLLAGDDAIIDNDATAALCRRAGAVVETIPNAAHSLVFERPEHLADAMARRAEAATAAFRNPVGTVWVVGGGAVGGAVASLLADGAVRTGMLVKPKYLDSVRKDGFTLHCGLGSRTASPCLQFADSPGELPGPPDLVVVAVKSFDTVQALSPLVGKIPASTVVASLQNGVGNEDVIAGLFPDNTIVAASICASLELTDPGHVVWADDRGGLGAALHRGDEAIARSVWQNIMTRTGMECRWVGGKRASSRLKWSKLMLNTAFNALNSVTGLGSAAILADGKYGDLALRALAEGFAAMYRLKLDPVDLPGFPVSKLRLLLKMPSLVARRIMAWQAARAPEVAFSMRQDFLKNRQHTEITELNGKIVEVGRQLGIDVSANEKLVELVKNNQKKQCVS